MFVELCCTHTRRTCFKFGLAMLNRFSVPQSQCMCLYVRTRLHQPSRTYIHIKIVMGCYWELCGGSHHNGSFKPSTCRRAKQPELHWHSDCAGCSHNHPWNYSSHNNCAVSKLPIPAAPVFGHTSDCRCLLIPTNLEIGSMVKSAYISWHNHV
jgi:hypothetical protein